MREKVKKKGEKIVTRRVISSLVVSGYVVIESHLYSLCFLINCFMVLTLQSDSVRCLISCLLFMIICIHKQYDVVYDLNYDCLWLRVHSDRCVYMPVEFTQETLTPLQFCNS